jgi:hypothetical protein
MSGFYQSKSDFYKSLIDIHKKCGQGLSGIVRVKSDLLGRYLDELIEEGLVKCCDTGGSLGHPESNRFYCPTKGYCVWDDYNSMQQSLTFIRLYLNILETESTSPIHPTITDVIRNTDFMTGYANWLKKNEVALKEMTELSDVYNDSLDGGLPQKMIDYVKTRSWFEKNETVANCIKTLIKGDNDIDQQIKLQKELLNLKKRANQIGGNHNIQKDQEELDEMLSQAKMRPQIRTWLETQNSTELIQNIIK